jgi:hypothetical protein
VLALKSADSFGAWRDEARLPSLLTSAVESLFLSLVYRPLSIRQKGNHLGLHQFQVNIPLG